jgi:RNA polymerase sigma factor (sigma-70 family)
MISEAVGVFTRPAAKENRGVSVTLFKVGAEAQIERLYRDRYVGFRNALTPVVGTREAARDVVQEAFAQALRDVSKLRRQDSLAPWVWKIAWRIALRERLRSTEAELPEDLGLARQDEEGDPELGAAIRSLPPKRRMVVFLRYFADFSYAEIAEALGVTQGTVAASLAQARSAQREQLMAAEVVRCRPMAT